jgi:hypothetical protein
VISVRAASTDRPVKAFARHRGAIFTVQLPARVKTASKASVNCLAAVADQELEVRCTVSAIH